jgi:hypothetical protein
MSSTLMLKRCACCTCDPLVALAVGSVTVDLSGLGAAQTPDCTTPPCAPSLASYALGWSGLGGAATPCLFTSPSSVNLCIGGRIFDSVTLAWNQGQCRWELAIYGQNGGGVWDTSQSPPVWVPNPHPLEVIWFGVRAKAPGVRGQFDAHGVFVPADARGTYTQAGGCATGPASINVT